MIFTLQRKQFHHHLQSKYANHEFITLRNLAKARMATFHILLHFWQCQAISSNYGLFCVIIQLNGASLGLSKKPVFCVNIASKQVVTIIKQSPALG